MNITVRVSTTQKGSAEQWLADFEKRMKGPTAVKVGFPAGSSPADIVQIAVWNHFGTRGGRSGGGWGGPIPPRPFITAAVFKHRSQIRHNLRALYRSILAGKTDARIGLQRLALYGVNIIQDQIASGMKPANSPLTIKLKGSSKTLINTGRMRQSVTWSFDESAAGPFKPGAKRVKAARRNAIR